jgi:hypothetical protein
LFIVSTRKTFPGLRPLEFEHQFVRRGNTPVLDPAEARQLIDAIDTRGPRAFEVAAEFTEVETRSCLAPE